VQGATGQHAQLGAQRRCRAAEDVEAAAGLAAAVGGARQRPQARVVPGPPVVDGGGGHVADAPARRPPARLPLLLVAVELAALVEPARAVQRAAADRHVGSPRVVGVPVDGP
jgi:hypothetical protein